MKRLGVILKRKRLLFGGASVLFHLLLLLVVFHPTDEVEQSPEIAISFKGPRADAVEPAAANEAQAEEAQSAAGSPGAPGGPAPSPSDKTQVAHARAQSLRAILNTDLSVLRASLIVPAAMASQDFEKEGVGLSPAEPTIHLSDGTIDKLVNQGRGDDELGSGGSKVVSFSGNVCQ